MRPATSTDATVSELRHEIAQQRADLAASVDALAEKLDVKARLSAKAVGFKPFVLPVAAALLALVVLLKRRRA